MRVYKKIFQIRDRLGLRWVSEEELDELEQTHMEDYGKPYRYVYLQSQVIMSLVEPDEPPPVIRIHIKELLN